MAVNVSAFTAMARAEFMQGKLDAESRVMPANFDPFVTRMPSTVRVETHTYMSNLPRLREFKGKSPGTRLVSTPYTVENKEYRIGPVTVRKTDLDDDQIGGYLLTIKCLPEQGKKDIGFDLLSHIAAGDSRVCFDTSNFFAGAHVVGTGNNLMTASDASEDGVTHKIIALNLDNPAIKPVIFQDRESLGTLQTTQGTPTAEEEKEYRYWADARYGKAYGFWWDAIKLTITNTPTLTELQGHIRDIISRFRTFTLPVAEAVDTPMYVHENWVPSPTNLTLLCSMQLAELLDAVRTTELIAAGVAGATITNQYRDKFTMVPTSALN